MISWPFLVEAFEAGFDFPFSGFAWVNVPVDEDLRDR